jgi:hypothetical protein
MKKFLLIFCLLASPCLAQDLTVINALNLNAYQKKKLETIDEKNDKEFKKILTYKQKRKLHEIKRLEHAAGKHADKRLFKPDPNLPVFGMKEECCPNHANNL